MFVKGIYSPAEQAMLDAWRENAEKSVGWLGDEPDFRSATPVNIRTADEMMILMAARCHDYKNRLYRDAKYAAASRWGKIIAPPMFLLTIGFGCGHFMQITPEVGTFVSCHFGEDFHWERPVYVDDNFKVYQNLPYMVDETPEGEQKCRILASYDKIDYYSQNDELIGSFTHIVKYIYTAPGTPYGDVMTIGYEMNRDMLASFGSVRKTPEFVYTPEQIRAIERLYLDEPIRGRETRYWEDVQVGEVLPPVILGPITEWDEVAAMATHAESTLNMMEMRRLSPRNCFVDPVTNVPHEAAEIHLIEDVVDLINWYSPTIVEHVINSFLCRLVTNWMGDDGMITDFRWRKFANTTFGDTVIGRGRVVRKYINEKGECLVDIDTCMENVRGFLGNMGPCTVRLPSRCERIPGKKAEPCTQPPLELNPQNIQPGDRFCVCSREHWELPDCEYPLAGQTGRVVELPLDVPGYVYAVMDNDCTGLDPRAVVGFRMDQIKKL